MLPFWAPGWHRAKVAPWKPVKQALNSPLLNDTDIKGAKNILLNIISGNEEVTMDEIGQIIDYVKDCSGLNADLIWGNGTEASLGDQISVTVIATGFNANSIPELYILKREIDRIPLADFTVRQNDEESIFVVKDAPTQKTGVGSASQRTIEFELKTADDELFRNISRVRRPVDARKAGDRVNTIKRTQEELKELKQGIRQSDKEIDELENTPAFKRKQLQIDPQKYSDETRISRYSLTDDDNSGETEQGKSVFTRGGGLGNLKMLKMLKLDTECWMLDTVMLDAYNMPNLHATPPTHPVSNIQYLLSPAS